MKLNLHLGEHANVTIDITDDSIIWSQATGGSVTWAADIVSQISAMFPKYKLIAFDFSHNIDKPVSHLNSEMQITAVWNFLK